MRPSEGRSQVFGQGWGDLPADLQVDDDELDQIPTRVDLFLAPLKALNSSAAAGRGSEGRRGGEKDKRFYFSASKVKKIGDLGDESPFPDFPCCTPPLVIDQEKITQGFVNDVKADVTGNFLYRTIVLDQGV